MISWGRTEAISAVLPGDHEQCASGKCGSSGKSHPPQPGRRINASAVRMAQVDKEGENSVFGCDLHAAAVFFGSSPDISQPQPVIVFVRFAGIKRGQLARERIGYFQGKDFFAVCGAQGDLPLFLWKLQAGFQGIVQGVAQDGAQIRTFKGQGLGMRTWT